MGRIAHHRAGLHGSGRGTRRGPGCRAGQGPDVPAPQVMVERQPLQAELKAETSAGAGGTDVRLESPDTGRPKGRFQSLWEQLNRRLSDPKRGFGDLRLPAGPDVGYRLSDIGRRVTCQWQSAAWGWPAGRSEPPASRAPESRVPGRQGAARQALGGTGFGERVLGEREMGQGAGSVAEGCTGHRRAPAAGDVMPEGCDGVMACWPAAAPGALSPWPREANPLGVR